MTRALYLDCSAGISGDMTVAALLDAGASQKKLRGVLNSLLVSGFTVNISRVKKSGLDACDFDVVLSTHHDNHDHDMEYLYGHAHEGEQDDRGHCREGEGCHHHHEPGDEGCRHHHEHHHVHDHHHGHDHHHHEHRGLAEIIPIIDNCAATAGAKALAKRIFNVIAAAEAQAHGVPVDQVHFHEVGAVDSIVDVIAAAVCFDDLGISEVIVPRLCEGQGTVRCQHGVLPVPVPAVTNIISAHQIPLSIIDVQGELVTPTGAAIVAALRTTSQLPETFTIERVGLGAGKRVYPETSGLVRALIINDEI